MLDFVYSRYGGWQAFKGSSCKSALEVIKVGMKEKNNIYLVASYAIQYLAGQYKGSYEDFEKQIFSHTKKAEISFDEAGAIADKILARKVKKDGNR